jgi:uncharacterized protein (DUF1330 family)
MKPYAEKVRATIAAHGGRPIVNGSAITVMEGDWAPTRMVVLQFDSVETATAWYNSPEYQEILPYRLDNTDDRLLIVEGL